MKWYLHVLKNYVNFNGRARRKEYWMFYLLSILIGYGINLFDFLFQSIGAPEFFLSSIYNIFLILPTIAVGVRRLHDIDKSGFYLFLAFLPIIGWIWLFVLLVQNGDTGTNQYGPDPKNPMNELDEIGLSEV